MGSHKFPVITSTCIYNLKNATLILMIFGTCENRNAMSDQRLRLNWNLTNQKKNTISSLVNFALIGSNLIQFQWPNV